MEDITIGYLSWKRNNIFKQTLTSHKDNGLYNIIPPKNRLIYFQEISTIDIDLAKQFECNYMGSNENVGILNAFIKLVENCETEYFIFCENDWYLVENDIITRKILEDSIEMLDRGITNIVRLRHRIKYGEPLYSKPSNIVEWLQYNYNRFPYKLESLSWLDEPNKVYNNVMDEYDGNYKWYIVSLEHQRWSNNVFICKTSYIREVILPLVLYFIETDKYSGLEDILINYTKYIGRDNTLDDIIKIYSLVKIAGGEGLFMHTDKVVL